MLMYHQPRPFTKISNNLRCFGWYSFANFSHALKSNKYKKKVLSLGFVDFYSLKYFSYIVSILQRSGHRFYYWRVLSNVLQATALQVSNLSTQQADYFKSNRVAGFDHLISKSCISDIEFKVFRYFLLVLFFTRSRR